MNDRDLSVIETMETYGGSFIVALAGAARRADAYNLQKIKNTWHKEWNEYVLMHEMLRYTENAESRTETNGVM